MNETNPESWCRRRFAILTVVLSAFCLQFSGSLADAAESAPATWIELTLQRRDAKTGEIEFTKEKVDPAHVGIVVVDMWNFHWCKTSTQRVGALVPRMATVLRAAHGMGMTINLAMHSNVVFKVFIDGNLMGQSPIMRMSEGPWRFDVKIPPASRHVSLVAEDGGAGNEEDLADWVNAGFVVKK